MNPYKADLHIHTVLSPCGDLEMSPTAIVARALERGLDMIAITDHNTTRQVKVTQRVGRENGLFVLGGVEITRKPTASTSSVPTSSSTSSRRLSTPTSLRFPSTRTASDISSSSTRTRR